jgi:hypothetical protein
MRTSLILLSAAVLLVACNDSTGTTGPRSRPTNAPGSDVSPAFVADFPPGPSAPRAAADTPPGPNALRAAPDFPPGPNVHSQATSAVAASAADYPPGPNLKPTTGFTTIVTVESQQAFFGGVLNGLAYPTHGTVTMTCPAGTKVIGGGFDVFGTHPQDLAVETSKPDGANGWKVKVEEIGGSGSYARLTVTAICVQ